MLSFKQFVNESSLNRFYSHLKNNTPFMIITASRSDCSKKQNDANNKFLRSKAKLAGFGYNRVKGTYKETIIKDGKEVVVDVEDDSIIMYGSINTERILLNFGMAMGKKFNQDSILFFGKFTDYKPALIATRNDTELGRIGNKHILGRFHPNSINDVMTVIKGKPYHFDWDQQVESTISNTFNEAMVRSAFCKYLAEHDSLDDWNPANG